MKSKPRPLSERTYRAMDRIMAELLAKPPGDPDAPPMLLGLPIVEVEGLGGDQFYIVSGPLPPEDEG